MLTKQPYEPLLEGQLRHGVSELVNGVVQITPGSVTQRHHVVKRLSTKAN